MSAENDDRLAIRITDKGAITAVTQAIDTLIHIQSIVGSYRVKTIRGVIGKLRAQLRKFVRWLDRVPDGTLLQHGITQQEVNHIRQGARMVLGWKMLPSERDFAKWNRYAKKAQSLQEQKDRAVAHRVGVLPDTSFLASYLSDSEASSESTKVIVGYLKTQRPYFDLYLSNLVLLELISKLKQRHSFKTARLKFNGLLEEISQSRVALSDSGFTMLNIFDRYDQFSRRTLSSRLRSNDFFIATDAILANAMLLTCDRKMHEAVKKTCQDVYYVDDKPTSYVEFINSFEKRKAALTEEGPTKELSNGPNQTGTQ